jgi:ligand-binding sensor domain-containing protein
MNKIIYILTFTIIGCIQIFSQNPNCILYNSSNSGLPINWVHSLAIDGLNNKWIGTYWNGLIKYDGFDWTSYSLCPSDFVTTLAVDKNNNLWATACELVKYDGFDWTYYTLPTGDINYLLIDKENVKWMGDYYGHLISFDDSTWNIYNTSGGQSFDNNVCLAIDSAGIKWVGSRYGGLEIFDGSNWTVINPNIDVRSIAIDQFNIKWIATWGTGLAKYDDTTWTFYTPFNSNFPDHYVREVLFDSTGILWIAGSDNGLTKYDGINWMTLNSLNSCLTSNDIFCLSTDSYNNLWIGSYTPYDTLPGGLAVYNENGVVNISRENDYKTDGYILGQNYPNPFNSATEIQYSLLNRSKVTLKVYDILGNELKTLVNEEKDQGVYTINFDANNLASGLYLYRLQAGDFVQTKKMILMK